MKPEIDYAGNLRSSPKREQAIKAALKELRKGFKGSVWKVYINEDKDSLGSIHGINFLFDKYGR